MGINAEWSRVDIDGKGHFEAKNIRKWINIWGRLLIEHTHKYTSTPEASHRLL